MTMRLEYKKTSTLLLNDDVLKELIKVGTLRTKDYYKGPSKMTYVYNGIRVK